MEDICLRERGAGESVRRSPEKDSLRREKNIRARRRRRKRIFGLFLGAVIISGVCFEIGKSWDRFSGEAPSATGDAPAEGENNGTPGDSGSAGRLNRENWELTLVNSDCRLPEDYQVPALTELENGLSVDSRIFESLETMLEDARAEGLQPVVCSAFRTRETQEGLFRNKVDALLEQGYSREEAETEAARWVAVPGTSEHETGLAVDIVDLNYQILDARQEETPVQQWLLAHCAEYGFILRYPTDKSEITGIGYEPWHYRYVGVEAAAEITQGNLCLEEYLG